MTNLAPSGPTLPTDQGTTDRKADKKANRKFVAWAFLCAVAGGWGIEFVYGFVAEPDFLAGIRTFCLIWFASGAAFFVGTIGGFLFGVPKSVSDPTASIASSGTRYTINTNLEEISDWLTKIILGLGLVHFNWVIHFIDSVGDQAGNAIGKAQGAKLIAISSMVYGFVCGFIIVYTWTRTALKEDFEEIERARTGVSGQPATGSVGPIVGNSSTQPGL